MLDDLRRLTRDLIEDVAEEVGAVTFYRTPPASLDAAADEHGANVVIVGRDDPSLASTLLEKRPQTRMLAVVDDGERSVLYELRPQKRELGELSRDTLANELLQAREPRSSWMA